MQPCFFKGAYFQTVVKFIKIEGFCFDQLGRKIVSIIKIRCLLHMNNNSSELP